MIQRELLRYWPNDEDVVACMKTDAEAANEAVSLAVHQPMQFEKRVVGSEATVVGQCDEHELLRALIAENLPEGRVILPIVGRSGIGKSHAIRWLDAQIRRMPGSQRRVVIRIPKGTSLKGVLGILLDEVQGPSYEKFRSELARAQQELDPKEAAGLLCEMLAHALSEMGAEARAQLLANPADRTAQERDAYCRRDMLPALLRNQLLRDSHFVRCADGSDGVAKRLVEQLTEGRAAGSEDDRQHLFTPNDLIFSDGVDRDSLGRAELAAVTHLDREDRRLAACRILNKALDNAKQRLLRLDPTISELFDAVRKELLLEKKELFLLVEDFAVLSGIQKQILQVIIKEAIRDGRQVLCTMRTALAYTDGYMDTATVLTRANIEYGIPDEPGTEEEILGRVQRLVGAYLNAARHGQSKLEKAYGQVSEGEISKGWVPPFSASVEPEARATLEAFGLSSDGHDLFPFNAAAIEELAREGCMRANRLVYNPRFVIQNVMNRVLVHRELFENGSFPPASFGASGRRLPARVAEDVKQRVPPAELDRYLRFLVYWGGCPGALDEIVQVEPRVFSVFGLDRSLFGHALASPRPTPKRPVPESEQPSTQQGSERSRPKDPRETKWEERLEQWRAGIQLPQAEANQLRKAISEALKDYIDWDWDLFRPLARDAATWSRWFSEWVYIPNAAGQGGKTADQAMVVVCDESDLSDEARSARAHATLMAVIRFHEVHRSSWDYEGAEEDLPRYAALLEKLAMPARTFIRARYFRADWDSAPAIVQGLLIGSRALGIDSALREDHAALIQVLFAAAPEAPANHPGATTAGDATDWPAFVDVLRKCRATGEKESRDQLSWTGHLLNLVGARQGQADTVHAIDLVRLKPVIDEVLKTWGFTSVPPNPSGVPEFAQFRTTYAELKKLGSAATRAQHRLSLWRSRMLEWLGDGANKDLLVREFKETVEGAKAAGLTGGVETKRLLQLIEDFRVAKVMAALEDVAKLGDDAPRGTVLAILGRGYEPVVQLCEDLQMRYDEFMVAVNAELKSEAMKYGEDPLAEAKATVASVLGELATLLKELRENATA
jgi:hypothetical protein